MSIIIRLATAADASAVSMLNADVQAIHSEALPSRFKPPGPETFPPKDAVVLLAQPANLVFIAEIDSLPVGYAYAEIVHRPETPFTYSYDMIHIHHISVRSSYRRQGAGHALIGAIRSAADERKIGLLTVNVWMFNEVARAFFHRHGLTPYVENLWSN